MNRRWVCIHGFLGAETQWEGVLGGWDAERVTLPGHGATPWTPSGDFESVVRALGERLMMTENMTLVGYSMGARVALALGLMWPREVKSLVLMSLHPGLRDEPSRTERALWEDSQAERVEREGMTRFVDAWESLPMFDTQRELDAETRARRRSERLGHTPEGIAWSLRTLGTGRMPSYWDRMRGLRGKAILVTGERDPKFTALARSTGLAVWVVPGAGHDVALEAPRDVAEILDEQRGED